MIPIVIYTGDEKWRNSKKMQETQISNYVLERSKINLEYNFIDINKLPKQILLERDSMFASIMLMEKARNKKELIENLENLIPLMTSEERVNGLVSRLNDLLDDVLAEKGQKECLEEIQIKVGKRYMSTLLDRLVEEGKMDIRRGKEVSKRNIARNMLNKKIEDKMILEITEMKKEELEKLKRSFEIT